MKNSTSVSVTFGWIIAVCVSGCGVKGKPMPPLEPAQIGRGAPTYKRTAEQAKPSSLPTPSPAPSGRGL